MKTYEEITSHKEMLNVARIFATKKHDGQMRQGGDPFITHPAAVAERLRKKGFSEFFQTVAWLHDVIEDTDATYTNLFEIGMPFCVIRHVEHMTKTSKQKYMKDYIEEIIAPCPVCNFVKEEDNAHNVSTLTPKMIESGDLPKRWDESQKALLKYREKLKLYDMVCFY